MTIFIVIGDDMGLTSPEFQALNRSQSGLCGLLVAY